MDFEEITYKYYSHWLGIEHTKLYEKGIFFVYNPDRDNIISGYSRIMDIYIFVKKDFIIVSYGDNTKDKMEIIKEKLKDFMGVESLKEIFESVYEKKVEHIIKYIYKHIFEKHKEITILDKEDYNRYLEFFKEIYKINDYTWVKDYFLELAVKRYCHGIVIDNKLVSVTDAPDMPYMKEYIQEIGINTREEYRGRGYAKDVSLSFIKELLSKNICPIWSTAIDNIASDKLAKSIGFEKLADNLTISL
jgi:RimJ/RimL family protein N-acetyltransferase